MLKLTDLQWLALNRDEAKRFVAAVCDGFLVDRPSAHEHPGRQTILVRMQQAYDYAARAGFNSTPHIVRLMVLAADAPRIHDDPLVDRYLRKPGATPEQRLDDLDAVMKHQLDGGA
ncbi:MAG: hypothetical protein QM702_00345 [Rubrivivax sp.]